MLAQTISLLREKLGRELGSFEHLFRIPAGDSENHIHDEYHRRIEPTVPPDHEEQAVFYQRRLSTQDALFGISAHRATLACQIPELGFGAQPTGAHVRRPHPRLTPLP